MLNLKLYLKLGVSQCQYKPGLQQLANLLILMMNPKTKRDLKAQIQLLTLKHDLLKYVRNCEVKIS